MRFMSIMSKLVISIYRWELAGDYTMMELVLEVKEFTQDVNVLIEYMVLGKS